MNTKTLLLLALGTATLPQLSSAQTGPQETRDILDKWVETKQIISEEKADWLLEESILQDTKSLLSSELERLEAALEEMEESASAADQERVDLAAEKESLKKASGVVEANIGALETKIKAIVKTFPAPMLEKIAVLERRIPDNPSNSKAPLGERVQNIVGILSQADKFNATVTPQSESREVADGKTVQVRTLYWGLALAYYVDASGDYSGIGHPTADGWAWPQVEGSGAKIKKLIDVYEGTEEIQFVEVPARIN